MCDAIFNFTINRQNGLKQIFHFDLKNGQGSMNDAHNVQSDAEFTLREEDYTDILNATVDFTVAFLKGKIVITGNLKKAMLFTPERVISKEKLVYPSKAAGHVLMKK